MCLIKSLLHDVMNRFLRTYMTCNTKNHKLIVKKNTYICRVDHIIITGCLHDFGHGGYTSLHAM